MKKRFEIVLALALSMLLLLLANAPPGTAQDRAGQTRSRPRVVGQEFKEGDSLKIGVELIQVVFSVVDEQNRLITDLQRPDVELYETGARQQIDLFQRSNNLPMVLSILIDMSGSQEFLLPDEKRAVDTFFDSYFREGKDYGSILTFQGETSLVVGLTSNARRLKSALGRIKREQNFRDDEGGVSDLGTALYDAIDATSRETLDGKSARRITGRDSEEGSQLTAIRRAIIVLTDGVDTASRIKPDRALRRAQMLGIAIYALGVGDRFRFSDVNREALDQICNETGGRAYYPRSESDLRQAFAQIADELSSQYILAYYPGGADDQQKFHEIEIKLPRRPGLRVIHRRGYVRSDE